MMDSSQRQGFSLARPPNRTAHRLTRLGLALILLAGGCPRTHSKPKPTAARRTVRDGLDRAVVLPTTITRVVSLAPSSTEILFALGAGPLLVGRDRYSDHPAAARALPAVGADVDPSLERIVSLKPDVVFTATTANTQATAEALERLGIAVYVSRVARLADIYRDILGLGQAVGREREATQLTDTMRKRLAELGARCAGRSPVPTVVVVWPEPLVVAGQASHISDLLGAACAVNLADDSAQPFPTYSVERLLKRAPAVILVGTHAGGQPPLEALLRLRSLPAVRDHRVHLVDGDLLFRPGPRLVDGVQAILPLLHPALGQRAP